MDVSIFSRAFASNKWRLSLSDWSCYRGVGADDCGVRENGIVHLGRVVGEVMNWG